MLEHEDPVRDADAERAPGHAFADHDGDDRHREPGHLAEVEGDRLADAPLLGSDARIGARRVDERHDRSAELLGLPHEPERLAVPLRVGHAEVASEVLLHVAALLLAHAHARPPAGAAPAADDRLVVPVVAVAVELHPLRHDPVDVVLGEGAARVPRHLHLLHRFEVGVRARPEVFELFPQHGDLVGHVDASAVGEIQELVDLILDLDDVPLEL